MSDRPWMPFYFGDFLADTMHLDRATAFSYLLLIGHYWQHGGLPDDPKQLAQIARVTPRTWQKTASTLQAFFNDGWKHKRIDEELAKSCAFSEKQRANVNKRWGKTATETDTTVLPARARLHPQSHSSEAGASAVPAQPPADDQCPPNPGHSAPVYTDSRHELWGEGVPILISLGLPEVRARSMIGSWLKQTRDDAQLVLGAIQRARDQHVVEPIAWITRAIPRKQESNHARRQDKPTNMESAARIAAHIEAGGSLDPTTWIDVPRPEGPPVRSGAGNGVAQLLPPKRH